MTAEDRVNAIVEFGFTERQARFLVTVMLHSGLCLPRQYIAFAGIVHGQKTRKFFAKLVRRGYARAYRCRHNRGRVYHLHHKPLYRAIDQTDSRYRRPMSASRVVEGLVLLDALLATPSVVWLATEEEKQVHLTGLAGVTLEAATCLVQPEPGSKTARAARNRMPIGVDLSGRWVFVYVVTGDQLEDFHWFLQRHAALLAVLPAWTLRLVFSPQMACLAERYDEAARNELAGLRPELVNHLRWYFDQRRTHTLSGEPIDDQERYDHAHYGFGATRFQVLYRRWLREGDVSLEAISSGAVAEAIERGAGRVECHGLPFSYRHLSPLVGSTPRESKGPRRVKIAPHRLGPLSVHRCLELARAPNVRFRGMRDDAKRLRQEHLARAGRASGRAGGRRSLPPENCRVNTATGA
jgi:hypothetical protein